MDRVAEARELAAGGADRRAISATAAGVAAGGDRRLRLSSSRAHSSAVPRMTGPQPRMPAATAPWSEPGSAASVIRAATLVGIIPCSAIATSSRSRKKRWSSVGSSAGEQQVEVLREAQAAHQVAGEVAPADLDPVGVGLGDAG